MRLLVPLLGLLLCLSACSSTPEAAPRDPAPSSSVAGATSAAPAPRPPRPRTGACYRLRYRDALSPTTDRRPVPCRKRHTAATFHVGRLDLRVGGRRLAVDSRRAQRQPAAACSARLGGHLGGTTDELRLSMLATVWFTPSLSDARAGARWFRCDVVAPGPRRSLLPLPARTAGALADPGLRERFAMCATAAPDADSFRRVTCGSDHSWRALTTVELPGRDYPARASMAARMAAPCKDAARGAADDPLDVVWSEELPTRAQWRAGRRYGICWAPEGD